MYISGCSRTSPACHHARSHQFPVEEQLLYRNVGRFQGGLVFKAQRLVCHSTLGWRIIKKKKKNTLFDQLAKIDNWLGGGGDGACCSLGQSAGIQVGIRGSGFRVWSLGLRVEDLGFRV